MTGLENHSWVVLWPFKVVSLVQGLVFRQLLHFKFKKAFYYFFCVFSAVKIFRKKVNKYNSTKNDGQMNQVYVNLIS